MLRLAWPTSLGARHLLALTLPALLLGYLVAAQVSTQNASSQLAVRYNTPLIDAVNALQNEQNDMKAQLAALRAKLDAIQAATATRSGTAAELARQLAEQKLRAGLVPLVGEGVVVALDDAKGVVNARTLEKSICHSTDITDIINSGWKAGAEAISVNDERVVGTSSVYCVGSTIMVNGTLMSPPFAVAIIGRQDRLLRVFDDPSELTDIKQRRELHGLGFSVSRQREVRVPAFTGGLGAHYATAQ